MLKYVNTQVTFAEVPSEITLCINISQCPCHCIGCHSSYLAEDIGEELNTRSLRELIDNNKGITCVSFMGGDISGAYINMLASFIKRNYNLKVCWYSGRQELNKSIDLKNFNIIKLGPYIQKFGPLNCPTTNQKYYKIKNGKLYDYTYLFWKNSMIEVWRDIPKYKGYQVSNLGNIRSLNYNGTGEIKILKPIKSGKNRNYLSVSFQVRTKVIRRNIHRLVAEAFIPNPNFLPEINHKDENGLNNNVSNLEWCTREYNINYGTRI